MTLTRHKPMSRGASSRAPTRDPRPDRSAEFASWQPRAKVAAAAVMVADLHQRAPAAVVPREARHESDAWRRAVAALPCVLCRREGATQAAHRNEGKGMGVKTDDALTAALCTNCHAAIDQGPDFSRDERRRRMDTAILLTIRALGRAGKLRISP